MRDNPKLSPFAQVDTGLTRFVCGLLGGLKHLALWMLGLIAVADFFALIFEYGEGLADMALHEWVFMLLVLALTWRHCHYARHFGYGFWRGLGRWLTAQGVLLAIELASLGVIVWPSLEFASYAKALDSLDLVNKEEEILSLAFALLALYLGAPTQARTAEQPKPVTENARQEPSTSPPPDEAVRP
jgi:hypothetical protein